MATEQEWATRLTEAETALHKLMTGSAVVELTSPDGTRVRYQEADLQKLQSYVDYCQLKKLQAAGTPAGPIYILP